MLLQAQAAQVQANQAQAQAQANQARAGGAAAPLGTARQASGGIPRISTPNLTPGAPATRLTPQQLLQLQQQQQQRSLSGQGTGTGAVAMNGVATSAATANGTAITAPPANVGANSPSPASGAMVAQPGQASGAGARAASNHYQLYSADRLNEMRMMLVSEP